MPVTSAPPTGGYTSKIDSALDQNKLTVLTVILMVIAAAAPFTVIAGGATAGWAVTGVLGIPVAYVAMAVVLGVFSVGYTEMSRHIVNSGAFYAYVAQGWAASPASAPPVSRCSRTTSCRSAGPGRAEHRVQRHRARRAARRRGHHRADLLDR